MTNTQSHAQRELDILCSLYPDPDNPPIIKEFIPEILALCEKFGQSGQSGGSAPYTAKAISDAVKKLCLQETICPLTGRDDEWMTQHMDETMHQNNREGAVFKDGKDGRAYYLDAIIWKGDTEGESGNDWDTFTGKVEGVYSRQYVKSFPFKPKRFYIDVTRVPFNKSIHNTDDAVTCGDGDYVYLLKDKKQLDKVFEYYDRFEFVRIEKKASEPIPDIATMPGASQG